MTCTKIGPCAQDKERCQVASCLYSPGIREEVGAVSRLVAVSREEEPCTK